jgi:hypothetical protein
MYASIHAEFDYIYYNQIDSNVLALGLAESYEIGSNNNELIDTKSIDIVCAALQ